MAANNEDDEDTREHPLAPRLPDAAAPGEPAPTTGVETGATGGAPGAPQPWSSAPTAQWPQAGQGWQDPRAPGHQTQQPSAQSWAPPPSDQRPGATGAPGTWQQPPGTWQQPPSSGWQGPPGQPPAAWQQPPPGAWQQPNQWGQQPAWAGQPEYRGADYPTSAMVVIAGIILIVYGLFTTLIGGLGVAIGGFVEEIIGDVQQQGLEGLEELEGLDLSGLGDVIVVIFAFVLIIGILHIVSAIGLFLHKGWARIIAIVLAVLGTLFGVLSLAGASSVAGTLDSSEWIVPILMTAGYGFCLFALIAGGNHFRRRYPR